MKTFEYFGPPGTGKTFLYQAMVTRPEMRRLAVPREQQIENALINGFGKPGLRSLLGASLRLRGVGAMIRHHLISRGATLYMDDYLQDHAPFVQTGLSLATIPGRSEARRIYGLELFINHLKTSAVIEQWAPGLSSLTDEGFCQKVFGLIPWSMDYSTEVGTYFETLPEPAGVIHITCDAETIHKNIERRASETGRRIQAHRTSSTNELSKVVQASIDLASEGVRILKSRGVPTLTINTTGTPDLLDDHLQKISEFIMKGSRV